MPRTTQQACATGARKIHQGSLWSNAPGRVNIIGEHTDHQFYGVLPTCINRSITIEGTVDESRDYVLRLSNKNDQFPTVVFQTYSDIKLIPGSWCNYAVAAYTGLIEYMSTGIDQPDMANICNLVNCQAGETCEKLAKTSVIPTGLDLCVSSDLPAAAGVSSSSALCVALMNAFLQAINIGQYGARFSEVYHSTTYYRPEKIAEFSVPAERHCGTASGGMDQAIICLGKKGIALNIEFEPLTANEVALPEGMVLIVANTGRKSAKAEMAPFMYNKRVFELRLGNLLLLEAGLKRKGLDSLPEDITHSEYLPRTRDVERYLGLSFTELGKLCRESMKDEYSSDEIVEKFGIQKINQLLKLCGEDVLRLNSYFRLKQPILHVLGETSRVADFVEVCKSAKMTSEDSIVTAKKLGILMNESHESLRDHFGNSCEELEMMTKVARNAGAYGARMTGAGWGGCCVIAVNCSEAEKIKAVLLEQYYTPTITAQMKAGDRAVTVLPEPTDEKVIDQELLKDTCFIVEPSGSATSGIC